MSLSSSMNASVAGLSSNATQLASISDNIANSSTYGYKRVETDFEAMVIGNSPSTYTAGGVSTTNIRLIDDRGPLIGTENATDLAVDGRGMLPVTSMNEVDGGNPNPPLMLTTTGSFYPNAEGYLTTSSGLVLMGWPADDNGTIPSYPRDTTAGLEPIQIASSQLYGSPTTEVGIGVNLPATSTTAGSTTGPEVMTVEYFDNLGKSETLTITYTPTVPASGSSNSWTMVITDSASGGAVIGEYDLVFDASRADGGTLATVTDVTGGPYDPATGTMQVNVAGGPMDINIGTPGQADGMTQLSEGYIPYRSERNGASVGILTSVEVDANGYVYAVYDTGETRMMYQVPIVDVPNPNGLEARSGQTFAVTQASGGFFLWDAGDGPTGAVEAYAREESTVDVAAELTQMIQTQRAYSSNAKVIQTVDEMLQETTNLKR
ncbi:MAG: flagellar hook-basal body complex protein [Rhodobacterales bacterium]|nr:flagellar hook-basal body complex protein [Rhodobacterales bacterium]